MQKVMKLLKNTIFQMVLLVSITCGFGATAQAEGEPFYPPVAQLPWGCSGLFAAWFCQSNPTFEYALEQEYWGYLGNADYSGLDQWLSKTKGYLKVANYMPSKTEARLKTFTAFGHVGKYVQGATFDPFNMINVMEALYFSTSAMELDPDYPNLQSLHFYLNAYMNFATFHPAEGQGYIDDLYNITQVYGPDAGSEGELVGAMAQILLKDDAEVAIGLSALSDCETIPCQSISSTAPYKEVGMQIAIAEGYARLGDMASMNAAYDKAWAYATLHNHPYPEVITRSQDALLDPGGVLEQWQTTNTSLGELLLPLPPSAGADACQSCHASGFQTVNHY